MDGMSKQKSMEKNDHKVKDGLAQTRPANRWLSKLSPTRLQKREGMVNETLFATNNSHLANSSILHSNLTSIIQTTMSLSSDDFNILGSMEAQAHVYLEALAKMKSPLKQIELEAEALDSIWTVLQGKRMS